MFHRAPALREPCALSLAARSMLAEAGAPPPPTTSSDWVAERERVIEENEERLQRLLLENRTKLQARGRASQTRCAHC